jgi:hypothetical protein
MDLFEQLRNNVSYVLTSRHGVFPRELQLLGTHTQITYGTAEEHAMVDFMPRYTYQN